MMHKWQWRMGACIEPDVHMQKHGEVALSIFLLPSSIRDALGTYTWQAEVDADRE